MLSNKRLSFLLYFILTLSVVGDFCYSYYQYSLIPMDGDVTSIALPCPAYQRVLDEPLGLKAVFNNEHYPATNRFSAHGSLFIYFRTMPLFLQHFVSPVESVFLSAALAKISIHILFVGLIALFISAVFSFRWQEGLIGAVLVTPLLQANGTFFTYMGAIDTSVTYAFFYALPMVLILTFFFPFFKSIFYNTSSFPNWLKPVWIIIPFFLVFFGPITAAVLILVCPSVLLYLFVRNYIPKKGNSFLNRILLSIKQINKDLLVCFVVTTLMSLYSLYLGTKNCENDWWPLPLNERYLKLCYGLIDCFINVEQGLIFLLIAILINLYFLRKVKFDNSKKISSLFFWIGIFIIVYILLLPLGGYRAYRPFILRRDSIIPVLTLLYFVWSLSSIILVSHFTSYKKYFYIFFLASVCVFYYNSDGIPTITNNCEKIELEKLAASKEDCVALDNSCTVINWSVVDSCHKTTSIGKMFYYWNITSKEKEYYQPTTK